jgi:hypothetical protein
MEFGDKVFIGGDVQGTGWNNKVVHTQPKVFNKKGVLFGFTTSYRFGQVLEHNLQDPVVPLDANGDVYRWLISVLIPDIRRILKDNGYEKGGTCLIGVRGQLWEMQDDFSVLRSVCGYGSCGSGYEYAMGSMSTTMAVTPPRNEDEVIAMLKRAVYVAGTFSPSVGTDCTVVSV